MKIILVEKTSGNYLKKPGSYTRNVNEAMNFETEQEARRFCREYRINEHKIVAKFPARQLDDVLLGDV
jgi:hypothetical protein